ncbi:MAG: amidohydrolase [Lactobacillaceae bacterium]|jgi:amidohydrolase|nr:amidohydrolase [Lactobacillaceae bacterium]
MTKLTAQELADIRHYLHQHPELSDAEFATTEYLAAKLTEWGVPFTREGLATGLVAELGPDNGDIVAIRADIDALPIQEATGLPYASQNSGVMHACGHDFHMTALLGATYALKQNEATLPGKVRIFFQAAEEINHGGNQMVELGYVEGVKAIAGFHNMPDMAVGEIAVLDGAVFAGVDRFKVTINGHESHAAYPHQGADPIVAASAIVASLQTIIARNVDPIHSAVVSVTHLEAGTTWNVLPAEAWFEGTIRTFSAADQTLIKQRFTELVTSIATAYNTTATIEWVINPPVKVTTNDPRLAEAIRQTLPEQLTLVDVNPSNAGEDFSAYTAEIPGVFALIGSQGGAMLHQATLQVQDAALPGAVEYYLNAVPTLFKTN